MSILKRACPKGCPMLKSKLAGYDFVNIPERHIHGKFIEHPQRNKCALDQYGKTLSDGESPERSEFCLGFIKLFN